MRKLVILIITIIVSLPSFAQLEIKEGSFKEVPGFVNINPDDNYQKDDNDLPFAVIKVRTENINDKQRRELIFSGNAGTFIMLEYKDGEVWVYLTAKYADYIKISHHDLSSTEFAFPCDLQPKKGYELALINKFNYTPKPEKPEYNYLIITTNQLDALIYIDDVFIGKKEVQKSLKAGEKHKWKVECDYYHPEEGEVTVVMGEPIRINMTLRPAFGYINVTSEPENGAVVFIDGKNAGVTPYKTSRLKSGTYHVKVVKEMFNTTEQDVTVTDGNTTNAKLKMLANFVAVNVTTDSESDIYIDNEKKGRGKWSGRLSGGEHVFEAKKTAHKVSIKKATLMIGKDESIVIPNPEPICGALDISTTPMDAIIIIDGRKVGTSPRVLTDILVGKHTIRIEKDGYNSETREVIITESIKTDLSVTLSAGKEIIIETDNPGAKVLVDGKEIGKSPVKKVMTFGKHVISASKGNKSAIKEINISKQSVSNKVFMVLKKETLESYVKTGYKFLTLNASVNQYGNLSYGLTFGVVKRLGWFVSVSSSFNFVGYNIDYQCGNDMLVNGYYPGYNGNTSFSSLSVIGGVIMKVVGPLSFKVGAGYGMRAKCYETPNGYWVKNTDVSAHGVDLSVGAQYNFRGWVISLDGVTTNFKSYEAKIGLGFGIRNK